MSSFAEATAVTPIDSHTYSAYLDDDWAIGTVPHGGYVTALFLKVASVHFSSTLAGYNQPHTISLHLEFLRRSTVGPAIFKVQDIKLGRQTSNIHVSLSQEGKEEVVGYLINSNIQTENGPSTPNDWKLLPSAYPVDLRHLNDDQDKYWGRLEYLPFSNFRKALQRLKWWLPRNGQLSQELADEWISFENGDRMNQESLGFVCDCWQQLGEPGQGEGLNSITEEKYAELASYWYPTLVLNLDIKKVLPPEGVEFLFVRVRAKQTKNGRRDLEIVIIDDENDIVALSHHQCLILPVDRNLAARTKQGNDANGESKL
ncbi:MAG: hypothetical protein M1834_006537 [Cirrosporium novae-zelandiae]|nr:MAG: hypothetical protein M1834_006537 [Cirrosporium novae-zelandiae]